MLVPFSSIRHLFEYIKPALPRGPPLIALSSSEEALIYRLNPMLASVSTRRGRIDAGKSSSADAVVGGSLLGLSSAVVSELPLETSRIGLTFVGPPSVCAFCCACDTRGLRNYQLEKKP